MRKLYYFFSYLQGAGVATVVLTFWLATYYNVIIGWAIFYLFSSFADPLPWVSCNNTWNTPFCLDTPVNQTQQPVEIIEDYCSEEQKLNTTGVVQTTSSSQEFYEYVRQSNICNMSFMYKTLFVHLTSERSFFHITADGCFKQPPEQKISDLLGGSYLALYSLHG